MNLKNIKMNKTITLSKIQSQIIEYALEEKAFKPLNKKPIVPKENEIAINPRSRSAKLRIAERV